MYQEYKDNHYVDIYTLIIENLINWLFQLDSGM